MNRNWQRGLLLVVVVTSLTIGSLPAQQPAEDAKPSAPVAAQPRIDETDADTPLVAEPVRQLMQDGKYAEAIPAIDEAAKTKGAPVDYLAYLKGRSMYLDKRYDDAVAQFEALQKQFPGSPWARRARFAAAVALARKGDFRAAELIYRAEAEYLLSLDRKQQIADIYLAFADDYFDPPKDSQRKPDFKKALEFYKRALEVGPKPAKRVEVELLVAQCQQQMGQLAEAIKLYQQFVKAHPDSPLDIEARYRLGESQLAAGQLKPARRTWQDLLARYTDSKAERIAEAAYRLSLTWGIPPAGTGQQNNNSANAYQPVRQQRGAARPSSQSLSLGVAALEAFLKRFPQHKLAAQAHLDIGHSYRAAARYEDEVAVLKRFLADPRYKDAKEIPDAQTLLGGAYQLQKKFPEALATWREYLVKHPAHKGWSAVQRQIVDTEYLMGAEKAAEKQYDQARKLWAEFLAKYPLDSRNRAILFRFGQMNQQQKKWAEAIADWKRLVSKYPGTNEASQAQYMIGQVTEQELGKLEEALEQYKKVTWGSHAGAARQAIGRLTEKTMTVETERVFRSDETPKLKLRTRNIESVTVRAYKVDMETYFRKMHLARGVEGLDIALIDPDKTFEFKVPKYAKYQQLESAVEVPLPAEAAAGVMAVTISSKTLEATTMVIQSDLDVIVKSSRDEVFVFAQNMLTGKPWPGAKLLISNGQKVFAEGTTGPDGVFQSSALPKTDDGYKELEKSGDVRVFASSGQNVGSNLVSLSGVGVAQGLADKGYIYTDRPAYRAGQMVHVRGCIRTVPGRKSTPPAAAANNDAPFGPPAPSAAPGRSGPAPGQPAPKPPAGNDDPFGPPMPRADLAPSGPGPAPGEAAPKPPVGDEYVIRPGAKYTLSVFDVRNRLVCQEEIALGRFGTFHTHFMLPVTSPQGQYRVLVADKQGHSYQGTFTVHEYQLEPIRLVVDTPRHVYYRGEEIEGTIRAEYYYGAPLAGRKIRYQLCDEPFQEATTDAQGEVSFKLPTREFNESQTVVLAVTLPERNIMTAANFYLAAQGYTLRLETIRPLYVAGETFEVTVKAVDPEGKPAARKLTLSVLEQTKVQGRTGERLVEKHDLATDEKEGAARATLKLEKGGRYILRAEGTDRFENPVSGQHSVRISGDEDQVRLHILADRHSFKVGDTASVALHWREDPSLALVTYQGARILGYRLVELKTGPNKLEIPMSARLAPNFELAVAVMMDVRGDEGREAGGEGDEADADAPLADSPPKRRFHTASSPFTVERDLRVKIETKRKDNAKGPVRPGEELQVTITTTDPQGKPLAAELSLAMVEQSLLDRFSRSAPTIQDFFRGNPRRPAVRTTSSITFKYRPATKPIDRHLLAEEERLEIARSEEASSREALANRPGPAAPPMDAPATAAPRNGMDDAIEVQTEAVVVLEDGQIDANDIAMFGSSAVSNRQRLSGSQQMLRSYGGRARRMVQQQGGAMHYFNGSAPAQSRSERYSSMDLASRGPAEEPENLLENHFNYVEPSAGDLRQLVRQKRAQVQIMNKNGTFESFNFPVSLMSQKAAVRMAGELTEAGAVLMPGLGPQETGYWNPAVVTGEDGRATVTFAVPERSTAWHLLAKGITEQTLAGEATDKLTVKKDLFGELKLPLAFTGGDTAQIGVTVHNDAVAKGTIEVILKTTIGEKSVEEKKTIEVTAKGIHEIAFAANLKRSNAKEDKPGAAQQPTEVAVALELTVKAADRKDVVRRSVPLKPYGMPVFATASGTATSDTTAWVEPPAGMPFEHPALEILIGPTVQRSLLDIVLGPAPVCQIESGRIASGLETATSDLMAALALQKLIGTSREAAGPQSQALDARARASVGLLVSSQDDKGGWSWTGRGGAVNRYSSARAVWALSLARKAGYAVPDDSFNKALGYLRSQVAKTRDSDYESKAILLASLSAAGQGDFALANRLYRNRPALSNAALAQLALAFADMDRKSTAGELLALLAQRKLGETDKPAADTNSALPWNRGEAELRALYALALQKVSPKDPKAKAQIDWLLAHRTGHRWSPDKATGPAALALCAWFAENRFQAEHYKLTVFVNDVQAAVLDVDKDSGTTSIDVSPELLTPGKQRINFQITGRGQYAYQCILGGFVAADKVKSTTKQWQVRRTYEPAPLEVDGREVPRGFGVLQGNYSSFRNPLTQLPLGRRGQVELNVWRHNTSSNRADDEQFEYLVLTEPIPSGTTVIEKSVKGGFDRFEISPGAITFYIGARRHPGTIRYELYGYLPGSYRAAPSVVRDAYRPASLAVGTVKTLDVLPLGEKSKDPYRLTPQELFELGKIYFAKKDNVSLQTGGKHLGELVAKWNLRADTYKSAIQMLLDIHLELGPPQQIVRYFEIVKEKWPTEEIPFDKILKVGAAYHEMGEYERSYLVFRATVESSFARESGVAGFLEAQGEFLRSVRVMGRLLREYPPEGYVAAATYALAQRVYAKAPEAAADEDLRRRKINRVDLVRRAWRMLEGFLTAYPEDPAADQAAFSTASALLELKAYPETVAACNRYAKRYPKSDLLDSFWYIIGYCHFATGEHQAALQMCRKVAEATRLDKTTGRRVPSANKFRAIYILGQVYHSLGEAAKAIAEYRRVGDRFADAKEAIEYFVRKAIELPEVTTVKPGEAVDLELKFRNVAACDAKVYRIDLMKFSLLKQSLGGITNINLAGIRPYHEAAVKLGDGHDYRDRTHKLALPLKEEGAYLVVCRGDNLHTSGLVLVTPLAVEVQEEVSSGRVRTTVKDLGTDKYQGDVHVKVIGSRNADFVSGSTDLRGVFTADGIQGTSTVIAQLDKSRYAFFRGQTELVPASGQPVPQAAEQADPAPAASQKPANLEKQLLEDLQKTNYGFQKGQVEQLKQMYEHKGKGVKAHKAF